MARTITIKEPVQQTISNKSTEFDNAIEDVSNTISTLDNKIENLDTKFTSSISTLQEVVSNIDDHANEWYKDLLNKFYATRDELKYIKRYLTALNIVTIGIIIYLIIRG